MNQETFINADNYYNKVKFDMKAKEQEKEVNHALFCQSSIDYANISYFPKPLLNRLLKSIELTNCVRCINAGGKAWFCLKDVLKELNLDEELYREFKAQGRMPTNSITTISVQDTQFYYDFVKDYSYDFVLFVDAKGINNLRQYIGELILEELEEDDEDDDAGFNQTLGKKELKQEEPLSELSAEKLTIRNNFYAIVRNAFHKRISMQQFTIEDFTIDLLFPNERIAICFIKTHKEIDPQQLKKVELIKEFLSGVVWIYVDPTCMQDIGMLIATLNDVFKHHPLAES